MTNNLQDRFRERFVEMSLFYARDMHNRPPLYDTKNYDVDEIIAFVLSEVEQAKKEERVKLKLEMWESLPKEYMKDSPVAHISKFLREYKLSTEENIIRK